MHPYNFSMKHYSYEQMEEMLCELTKRVADLETSEESRADREFRFYPQWRKLCQRKSSEDCYEKSVVGPHNKPVVRPALLEDADMGGVYTASKKLLADRDREELERSIIRQRIILERVAERRAKRLAKKRHGGPHAPDEPKAPSDAGDGNIS